MYLISSAVVLVLTFEGELRDCPHEYTMYAQHSYHRGWTFTCEKFSMPMYILGSASITFDAISLVGVTTLLALALRYQIPLFVDLLDSRESSTSSSLPDQHSSPKIRDEEAEVDEASNV